MFKSKPKPEKKEKKKTSRKPKNPKQVLEARADRLVREIVILRDSRCVCPPPEKGHSDVLQPGHLITKVKKSIRWDLRNVNCQCSSCNMLHEHYSERYTSWYISEWGKEDYMKLVEDGYSIMKIGVQELEYICSCLSDILADMKKDLGLGIMPFPRDTQKEIMLRGQRVYCDGGVSG